MIEKIFVISMIVWAVWVTMQPYMIFESLSRFFTLYLPEFLHKPIFDCVVCMSGCYGAVAYWLLYGDAWKEWLIVNVACIGLNAVLAYAILPQAEMNNRILENWDTDDRFERTGFSKS